MTRFFSTNRRSFDWIALPHTAQTTGLGFLKNIDSSGEVYLSASSVHASPQGVTRQPGGCCKEPNGAQAASETDYTSITPQMNRPSGGGLGPYEIVSPLGAGGMGEVYRARDTRLDRQVAIKLLPSHLALDPDARARFDREAGAIAAISHPNWFDHVRRSTQP